MAICKETLLKLTSIPKCNPRCPNLSPSRFRAVRCNSQPLKTPNKKILRFEPEPVFESIKSFSLATVATSVLISISSAAPSMASVTPPPCVDPREITITSIKGDGGIEKKLNRNPLWNCTGIAVIALMRMLDVRSIGLLISLEKVMPLGSNLSSSAASASAAAVADNMMFGSKLALLYLINASLELETKVSGFHADNIALTIMGGFILIRSYDLLHIMPLRFSAEKELFFTPVNLEFEAPKKKMRVVLPSEIGLKDHVSNCSQASALVVLVLQGDVRVLGSALSSDGIVELARIKLILGMEGVKRETLEAGAFGCTISGARPTAIAIIDNAEKGKEIRECMMETFLKAWSC